MLGGSPYASPGEQQVAPQDAKPDGSPYASPGEQRVSPQDAKPDGSRWDA
ncbi:MAG: hypothetical protein WA374_02360 [Acidobacteriaceae bacterium]